MKNNLFLFIIHLIILILLINSASAASDDSADFRAIKSLSGSNHRIKLIRLSKKFFKRHPRSRYIPHIRLMLADEEPDPVKALRKYRILTDKYRHFKKNDYAQYRACEILYLLSRWNSLRKESMKGINRFRNSRYSTKFKFLLAKAYINLEKFYKAREICHDIAKTNHNYTYLSEAVLTLAYINRNIYGYSRRYLSGLKESITGFKDSGTEPAAVYLMGRYYERKRDYSKSYSAYREVIKKFPGSPESIFSKKRIKRIKKHNPKLVKYIPDSETIEKTDNIDIHPEVEITDEEYSARDTLYSISLGPFYNLRNAIDTRKLIKGDFKPVRIVKLRKHFILYVGRLKRFESVQNMKIRLAEEFGFNGKIVRIVRNSSRQYIYKD